ncbi:MAG: threonine-phosphate decarboxylase CobD [Oscillatoriaceae bacterium SKW80]|nr:threonine-phosphate decarboxylase CobD [Oscillatoriaceae bacterium SKYG93]MCX8122281.1 threonine-phosphate decarboxylase CobD [Oscillatoriaceae bacterium SKW80]MDW8452496.1 threonine-phosphate decarboxylase CobD [Oscillatoriaceae cyanobacterium SKYGB_i_bin93]HIK29658.1 threonine-phosphate decarboxylase [Oscillatoriaceae cyanobacterium M7585_C2015_266]
MQQRSAAHGGNLAWAAAIAGCSPSAILDFSASISPLGPPQSAIAAIQSRMGDIKAYPDPDYRELRAVLAELHQVNPDWILPGNGSAELLTLASWDFSQLAETYLITPAFGDYRRALRAFGVNVVECPLSLASTLSKTEATADLSQILQPRLMHRFRGMNDTAPDAPIPPDCLANAGLLLNNPHNPTGKLFRRETILPYLKKFAFVVVDEAFMDFLPPEKQESLVQDVQDYPNLVILRSLTKFYSLPGLRLGYALAHPKRLQLWQSRRDPWAVNVLAVAAAAAVVRDTAFEQVSRAWLPTARAQLFEGIAQLPGLRPYPSAANFILVESEYSTSKLQQKLLRQYKILIRDCLSFPELGERYFRIAVRSSSDNQRLLASLAAILNSD